MSDERPFTERRKHSRNLLREMRTRALGWSSVEILAVIETLQSCLSSGRVDGFAQDDRPEGGGTSPACPPEVNA